MDVLNIKSGDGQGERQPATFGDYKISSETITDEKGGLVIVIQVKDNDCQPKPK